MLTCNSHDNSVRWRAGERLNHLFEDRCNRFERAGRADHLAVDMGDLALTYSALDQRANQIARHLRENGIRPGDKVGLLLDKSHWTYAALLGVLKINAAYVPLDASYPPDRIAFILDDADVAAVVSLSRFKATLADVSLPCLLLDEDSAEIDRQAAGSLTAAESGAPANDLCYVIYTSGTTGRPKGVPIDHSSICNFVRVAVEVYGIDETDRVYQGMTIAFDFSVEELWVPLIAGATLVPAGNETNLVGDDLADFLDNNQVTALCCVPTVLATIGRELPHLRFVLVSGEACPRDLVARWNRPGRRMLNAYGPTEASVTATLKVLTPDSPITIGRPLPTYTILILDQHEAKEVAHGEQGEVCIAGVGVARGYIDRAELTEQRFIPDFLNIANNPGGTIYRTGDLGHINDCEEIEFQGRIDTQVKVRGYRIELAEIESVLLTAPQIAQAVVDTFEFEPGMRELVAYCTLRDGEAGLSRENLVKLLADRLPRYMIPTYLEILDEIPMLASNKADRNSLPAPIGPRLVGSTAAFAPARNELDERILEVLEGALQVERVSVNDDFFKDLGAHSLSMARFCAELRRSVGAVGVSMRDVYQNPTVARLSDRVAASLSQPGTVAPPESYRIPTNLEYYGCGALQFLYYCLYGYINFLIFFAGMRWLEAADTPVSYYLHAVSYTVSAFVALCAVPIALKWALIGKWREQRIPIWSLRYLRFWVVRSLVSASPLALFRGYPLYNFYLRLLGAKIGRHTVINCRSLPLCTDLISVGENTILRKDSLLLGYKAERNYIYIGPVRIGSNAFVGEGAVLDIGTVMEDRTQLGHASSLQTGQVIPEGKVYHGSPCQETPWDYCPIEAKHCGTARRAAYGAWHLASMFLVLVPVSLMLLNYLFVDRSKERPGDLEFSIDVLNVSPLDAWIDTALVAAGLMAWTILFGLLVVAVVPRVANQFLSQEKTYVLYGFHYWVFRLVSSTSNSYFFNLLFGDSSLIVHYLRLIGWKLSNSVQTGSNFGTAQAHENPFLCHVGTGTMVSDGLAMINMHMSSTSFRLRRVCIGEHNYLGNDIRFPPDHKVGDNCLLGTKVMIPIGGPVKSNVGLLGSPSFEIPRAVERDRALGRQLDEAERRRRVRRKNVHNGVTMAGLVLINWLYLFAALCMIGAVGSAYGQYGDLGAMAGMLFFVLFTTVYFVTTEWVGVGFRRMQPKVVSIYDPYYWYHERYWKFADSVLKMLFKGTPFRPAIFRLAGARIGRKVFDDGCVLIDKTLTDIGDYCTLNDSSLCQAHSLEEGVFKSDYVRVGRGCSVGPGALVHYGVRMGENVVLAPDSFLMKGEMPEPGTTWCGNPARQIGVPGAGEFLSLEPAPKPIVAAIRLADPVVGLGVVAAAQALPAMIGSKANVRQMGGLRREAKVP